ncbi:MAG: bacterioferritin-associated ferredoxin [Burkholderiales bacterium]
MYVCLCNGITDSQIRNAVNSGLRTLTELRGELGVATCCGRCADCAIDIISEAQRATRPVLRQLEVS